VAVGAAMGRMALGLPGRTVEGPGMGAAATGVTAAVEAAGRAAAGRDAIAPVGWLAAAGVMGAGAMTGAGVMIGAAMGVMGLSLLLRATFAKLDAIRSNGWSNGRGV